MSAGEFLLALSAIAVGVIVLTVFGVAWAAGAPVKDEPTEHGDGEP